MNLHRPLRTDRRLWLLCAVVAFVLLGFVSIQSEAVEYKVGPTHLWGVAEDALRDAARYDRRTALPTHVLKLAFQTAIVAIPAVALGWVAQAVIVVIWDAWRQRSERIAQRQN